MSDFHLDITAGRDRGTPEPIDEQPFRIALIGDWSGRGSRGESEPAVKVAARQPHRVDRDDLEEAMEDLAPALTLRLADGGALTLNFRSLDDFHPEGLFERLPLFEALRGMPTTVPKPVPQAGLLDSILAEASPADANEAIANSEGDLHKFLQQVLKGHLVPKPDGREADRKAQIDAAAGAALRAILHHPRFQALEALWRSADLLVRRVDTSTDLRLELIDLTEAELHASLAVDDPRQSPLYVMLTRQSQSAPWGLLASAFTLGGDAGDVERAAQLAAMGHLLGAPWIACGHPKLAGLDSFGGSDGEWTPPTDPALSALRASPLARSLGVVLPRFVVRMPYGREFDEVQSIRFEELEQPAHEDYLWAPGSFAVALILGRAFAEAGGWALSRSIEPEIGGLPHVVFGRGADARSVPTAETVMPERGAAKLMDQGLMVLATLKDQDRVRLLRLQSFASPLASLAGRWS